MLWNHTVYLYPQGVTPSYILVYRGTVLIGEWKAPSPRCVSGYWIKVLSSGQSDIHIYSQNIQMSFNSCWMWLTSIDNFIGWSVENSHFEHWPLMGKCQCLFDPLIFSLVLLYMNWYLGGKVIYFKYYWRSVSRFIIYQHFNNSISPFLEVSYSLSYRASRPPQPKPSQQWKPPSGTASRRQSVVIRAFSGQGRARWDKAVHVTLCHVGCVLLLMLCAARMARPQPIRCSPGGRGRPSRLTGRRGGGAGRSVTFFLCRAAASRTACSWTFDWAGNRTLLRTEAQDIFHLTVIHEILQAYLQVLRRLLLNLGCHRLHRLRHLPEIFFFPSLSRAEGFPTCENL